MSFESEGQIKPVDADEVARQKEYEKGKIITLPDGTTKLVHSVEEEIAARQEFRENQG